MNLVLAFILATAFAYLAATIYTALGKPALVDVDNRHQGAFFLILFAVLLYVYNNPSIWILNGLLGIFYSFATVASFTGLQRWMAYWKPNPAEGSGTAQIVMAIWDLTLAIAFLYLN